MRTGWHEPDRSRLYPVDQRRGYTVTPQDVEKMAQTGRGMKAEWPLWQQILLLAAAGFLLAQFGWRW
jgi:hypothetical protein